eukprot:scaffold240892_cov20-Prasinocladus_malaysianus.AAC.1
MQSQGPYQGRLFGWATVPTLPQALTNKLADTITNHNDTSISKTAKLQLVRILTMEINTVTVFKTTKSMMKMATAAVAAAAL